MVDISVKVLKELGIGLYNQQGEMKPLPVLIEDLRDAYYKINPESEPLLTIELQDETSVPKVLYKGEEITSKVHVVFNWETRGCRDFGGMNFLVKHFDQKGIARTFGKSFGDLV